MPRHEGHRINSGQQIIPRGYALSPDSMTQREQGEDHVIGYVDLRERQRQRREKSGTAETVC